MKLQVDQQDAVALTIPDGWKIGDGLATEIMDVP